MSSDEIYCGAKNPPKGKRKGTFEECSAKGQLRLYGLLKIEVEKLKEKNTKLRDELKLQRIKRDIDFQKNFIYGAKRRIMEIDTSMKKIKDIEALKQYEKEKQGREKALEGAQKKLDKAQENLEKLVI